MAFLVFGSSLRSCDYPNRGHSSNENDLCLVCMTEMGILTGSASRGSGMVAELVNRELKVWLVELFSNRRFRRSRRLSSWEGGLIRKKNVS
jgi:hypothetical protein